MVTDKIEKKTYSQKIDEHRASYNGLVYAPPEDPIEYRKMMEKQSLATLNDAFAKAVVHPNYKDQDFYVELRVSTESVKGTVRTKPFVLKACPSARYGSSVWKYHHRSGAIEYLWTLPGKKKYYEVIKDTQAYLNTPGSTTDTARFCHMLKDGSLLKLIQKENGYKKDGIIILKDS